MCPRCLRPVRVCYCQALTSLETRTRVVILQHPREQGMPIGTAHMAHLCLPRSELHVGLRWDGSEVLRRACADPARPAVLLYPGPDAEDILDAPPPGPVTLIVVDGTWSQARTIVRDNPGLAALPRYAFHAPAPSIYRIRREPKVEYVSTIEALMHVLGALEGEPARFRALLEPMDAMVKAQLRAQQEAERAGEAARTPRARPPRPPGARVPQEIRTRYEDLVLVYGDANAWPHGAPEREAGDELVYWVALRPSSGETFSFVLAPHKALAPEVGRYTGLGEAALRAGGSAQAFLGAFDAFLRPNDILASWGHHGLRLFKDCGGRLPGRYLDLQAAARRVANARPGMLEDYAARALGAPGPAPVPGRAGRRLELLRQIVQSWRTLD